MFLYRFIIYLFCGFLPLFLLLAQNNAENALSEDEKDKIDGKKQEEIFLQLDDETKQVYNFDTVFWFNQKVIQYNKGGYQPIYKHIVDFHQFSLVEKSKYTIQDLGNFGTAAQYIFFKIPKTVGRTTGLQNFDHYFTLPHKLMYYHTRSPYSALCWLKGEKGRNYLHVPYTVNVFKDWNIGADFKTILHDKQFGLHFAPGDRNVVHYAFDIHTNYRTKNKKYQLLCHFYRVRHHVQELGGIKKTIQKNLDDWFTKSVDKNLDNVMNKIYQLRYHAYHQYTFTKKYQIYHVFNWVKKNHIFSIYPLSSKEVFFLGSPKKYTEKKIDGKEEVVVNEKNYFRSYNHELGIKGDIYNWFYLLYYKKKNICAHYSRQYGKKRRYVENYIGYYTRYHFSPQKNHYLQHHVTYLPQEAYDVKLKYKNKIGYLTLQHLRHYPTLLVQYYNGSFFKWSNKWKKPIIQQVKTGIDIPLPYTFVHIHPHILWTKTKRPIYFNFNQKPTQAKKYAHILSSGIKLNFSFWKYLYWDNHLLYTSVFGPEKNVYDMPKYYVYAKIYYANKQLFDDKLMLEGGVELNFKSAYYANDYDPRIQQFFKQKNFNVYEYILMNLFLNFKINNFKMCLKVGHVNQGWINPGYFVTPLYPGHRMVFDVGIHWSFFD